MLKQIQDDKLKKILEDRSTVHAKIGEIMEKLMELDRERTKEGYKMERLKEKTKIIMDKMDFSLSEFEFIARVFLDGETPTVEILDQVEEYRNALREDKKRKAEEANK